MKFQSPAGVVLLLLCVAPGFVYAGCSLKPYDGGFEYSASALEARDAFYASLCDQSFFELVMLPDPRLKERISAPSGQRELVKQSFPEQARLYEH